MTEKIIHKYKRDIDEFTLIPLSGGVFEVYLNGNQIYSKDQTGEFPDEDEIVAKLGQ